MEVPPRWRLLQQQAAGKESVTKRGMNKTRLRRGKRGRTWSATGGGGLGEDGAVPFRTFLTRIFLVLAQTRGAAASESRFRLGVNLAVLGWICITLFEGGGAFLPKRTTGATARKQKSDPSSFSGSGPSSRCSSKVDSGGIQRNLKKEC
jgi:hypothetical protein